MDVNVLYRLLSNSPFTCTRTHSICTHKFGSRQERVSFSKSRKKKGKFRKKTSHRQNRRHSNEKSHSVYIKYSNTNVFMYTFVWMRIETELPDCISRNVTWNRHCDSASCLCAFVKLKCDFYGIISAMQCKSFCLQLTFHSRPHISFSQFVFIIFRSISFR